MRVGRAESGNLTDSEDWQAEELDMNEAYTVGWLEPGSEESTV